MMNPITAMFTAVRSRLYQMTAGIKKYLNPRYLGRLLNVQIKKMTQTLFSIRPRNGEDYYTLGRWAVSKKLAILLVVLINMGCVMLVMNLLPAAAPVGSEIAGQKLPSYKYTSLRLCGFDGSAQVLSSAGTVVYRGALEKGMAKGEGTLYDLKGKCVYVGAFDRNRYNGKGTLYDAGENVRYVGEFTDNLYSGVGTLYYPGNVKEYEGEFTASLRNGNGIAYRRDGHVLYEGTFVMDRIDFLRCLGMPSSELGCYKGENRLYEGDYSTAVLYPDFGLVYEMEPQAEDPTASTVVRCYDVNGSGSEQPPKTAEQLAKEYPEVIYRGDASLTTADYAAMELYEAQHMAQQLQKRYPFQLDPLGEGVYRVQAESESSIHIETYRNDQYCYTYYFPDPTEPYVFYSVERSPIQGNSH